MNNRRVVTNNVPFVRMGITSCDRYNNIDDNENDSKFSTNDNSSFCKEALTMLNNGNIIDDSRFNVCTVDETYNESNKNAIDHSKSSSVADYHPPTLKHQDIENIGEYNDDSSNNNNNNNNNRYDDDRYGNNCTFDGFFDDDEDDNGNVNIPTLLPDFEPTVTSYTLTNNESTIGTTCTGRTSSDSTNTICTFIMEEPILREFFDQLNNRRTMNENSTVYQRWKDEQEREWYLLDQTYRETLNQSMNEIFSFYDKKSKNNIFFHHHDDNTTGSQYVEHSLSTTYIDNTENEIHRRIQDYQTARYLRNYIANCTGRTNRKAATRQSLPYGISGVFQYISDIRTDLQWVAISADRRSKSLPYLSWLDYIEINIGTANALAATTTSTTSFPYFTYTLAIMCTITLVVQFAMNQWRFETMQVNPMVGSSVTVLIRLGAVAYNPIVHGGQYVRLLTSSLLHAGIIHWLINVVTVILLVPEIEYTYGSVTVAMIFIISAIGGNVLSCLWMNQYQIGVGASGGICGLIGICLTDTIVNWNLFSIPDITIVTRFTSTTTTNEKRNSENNDNYTKNTQHCITKENGLESYHLVKSSFPYVKVIISLVLEILLIVLIGFTPYVDQFAHLGGMLYGMCFGCFFIRANDSTILALKSKESIPSSSRFSYLYYYRCLPLRLPSVWRCISISIGLFLYSLSIALLLQSHYMYTSMNKNNKHNTIDYKNDTNNFAPGSSLNIPCSNCKYISCIPFPPWKSINDRWWNCDACDYVATFQYYQVPVGSNKRSSTKTAINYNNTNNNSSVIIKLRCPVGEMVRVVIDSNNDNDSADFKDDGSRSTSNGLPNDIIDGKQLRGYCRTLCNV